MCDTIVYILALVGATAIVIGSIQLIIKIGEYQDKKEARNRKIDFDITALKQSLEVEKKHIDEINERLNKISPETRPTSPFTLAAWLPNEVPIKLKKPRKKK